MIWKKEKLISQYNYKLLPYSLKMKKNEEDLKVKNVGEKKLSQANGEIIIAEANRMKETANSINKEPLSSISN